MGVFVFDQVDCSEGSFSEPSERSKVVVKAFVR